MTNIIDEYDSLSLEQLNNDGEVEAYRANINHEISEISNFKEGKSFLFFITHPIMLIKAEIGLRRINVISDNFEKLVSSSIVNFIDEETGHLEADLTYSMNYSKPKELKLFMDNNPIKKLNLNNKKC